MRNRRGREGTARHAGVQRATRPAPCITQRPLGAYTGHGGPSRPELPSEHPHGPDRMQAISRAAARWRATVLRGDLLGLEKSKKSHPRASRPRGLLVGTVQRFCDRYQTPEISKPRPAGKDGPKKDGKFRLFFPEPIPKYIFVMA